MTNQKEIRKVEPSDSYGITALNHELGYQTSSQLIEKQLSEILSSEDHFVFVAISDDEIVGYIHGFKAVRLTTETFVEIGALIVKENHRKKGIGKALVNHLEVHAKDTEKIRVRCNVKRTAAHDFYTALNFTGRKEQKVFEREVHTS